MKNLFLSLQWLFFLLICVNLQAQTVQQLRLDPTNAHGGNFSDFFIAVEFIPLETNSKSIFSTVDQLEITNKYFIILDRETNAILIFTKDGKFHAKVVGASIGYHSPMQYFYYDPLNNFILVPSPVKRNEIISINCEGKIVKKIATKFNTFDELHFFEDRSIVHLSYKVDMRLNSSVANEVFIEKSDKVLYKYFPYNTKYEPLKSNDVVWNSHISFYKTDVDSAALLVRPYDYQIYGVTKNSMGAAYKIVLPLNNTLPDNFRADSTLKIKKYNFLLEKPELVFNISHTYKLGNKLFFKLNSMGKSTYSLIYNFKDQSLVDIQKITPDNKSSYLSITDVAQGGTQFFNKNFLNTDGESLYTSYSASRFLNQIAENKDKIKSYPPNLEKILKELSAKSNNIIIRIKPRQD